MYKFDKKLIFFYFANGSSLIFGLLLYLLIVTNSDQNLPKLMFAYSIHLILLLFNFWFKPILIRKLKF